MRARTEDRSQRRSSRLTRGGSRPGGAGPRPRRPYSRRRSRPRHRARPCGRATPWARVTAPSPPALTSAATFVANAASASRRRSRYPATSTWTRALCPPAWCCTAARTTSSSACNVTPRGPTSTPRFSPSMRTVTSSSPISVRTVPSKPITRTSSPANSAACAACSSTGIVSTSTSASWSSSARVLARGAGPRLRPSPVPSTATVAAPAASGAAAAAPSSASPAPSARRWRSVPALLVGAWPVASLTVVRDGGRRAPPRPALEVRGPCRSSRRGRRRRRSVGFSRESGFTRARIRASERRNRPPRGSSRTSNSSSSSTTPSRSRASSLASSTVRAVTSIQSMCQRFRFFFRRAAFAEGRLPVPPPEAGPVRGAARRGWGWWRGRRFAVVLARLGRRSWVSGFLAASPGMLLLVHLVEHEVLLSDAPGVRDDEVEGGRRVEAIGDEPEEHRHDAGDRLHLLVDRGARAQLPGLRLADLVPARQHHEREQDQPRERVDDAVLQCIAGGLVELQPEEVHRASGVVAILIGLVACSGPRCAALAARRYGVEPVQGRRCVGRAPGRPESRNVPNTAMPIGRMSSSGRQPASGLILFSW